MSEHNDAIIIRHLYAFDSVFLYSKMQVPKSRSLIFKHTPKLEQNT